MGNDSTCILFELAEFNKLKSYAYVFACMHLYTYIRATRCYVQFCMSLCVYIVCMNMWAVWTALRTPLFGQSTIDILIVDFRQYNSDIPCSTGIFQLNVPCSRQYVPLNDLKKWKAIFLIIVNKIYIPVCIYNLIQHWIDIPAYRCARVCLEIGRDYS